MHSFYGGMVSALHGARTATLGFAIKKMPLRVKTKKLKKETLCFFGIKLFRLMVLLHLHVSQFHFFLCMCEGLRGGVGGCGFIPESWM